MLGWLNVEGEITCSKLDHKPHGVYRHNVMVDVKECELGRFFPEQKENLPGIYIFFKAQYLMTFWQFVEVACSITASICMNEMPFTEGKKKTHSVQHFNILGEVVQPASPCHLKQRRHTYNLQKFFFFYILSI